MRQSHDRYPLLLLVHGLPADAFRNHAVDGRVRDRQAQPRVDYWLEEWARYMRNADNLGWLQFKLSSAMAVRGSSHFDDLIEDDVKRTAAIVDALIFNLKPKPQAAVHSTHLGTTWMGQGSISALYAVARIEIEKGLDRWGVF